MRIEPGPGPRTSEFDETKKIEILDLLTNQYIDVTRLQKAATEEEEEQEEEEEEENSRERAQSRFLMKIVIGEGRGKKKPERGKPHKKLLGKALS